MPKMTQAETEAQHKNKIVVYFHDISQTTDRDELNTRVFSMGPCNLRKAIRLANTQAAKCGFGYGACVVVDGQALHTHEKALALSGVRSAKYLIANLKHRPKQA